MSRVAYVQSERASILKINRDTFSRHVVTPEGEGRWLFAAPDTGMFHFRVIAAPRAVIVYGDIDDIILVPSDRDALRWLRSVLRGDRGVYDLSYVAEKVRGRDSITEFKPRLLEEWVAERRREIEEQITDEKANDEPDEEAIEAAEERLSALDDLNLDPGSVDLAHAEIAELGDVDEYPDLRGLTHAFMLQVYGLQCFCMALDGMEAGGR